MNRVARMFSGWLLTVMLMASAACTSMGGPLEGTTWRLAGWSLSSLHPREFSITMTFADGKVSGHGGVNTYSGPYTRATGDRFSVGPLTSTEMAGPEPAMRAERAYMTLLGQAASYTMRDGRLTVYDAGGNESLMFEPADR